MLWCHGARLAHNPLASSKSLYGMHATSDHVCPALDDRWRKDARSWRYRGPSRAELDRMPQQRADSGRLAQVLAVSRLGHPHLRVRGWTYFPTGCRVGLNKFVWGMSGVNIVDLSIQTYWHMTIPWLVLGQEGDYFPVLSALEQKGTR